MDLKSWHEELKTNHGQTLEQLTNFILEYCPDDDAEWREIEYQRLYTIAVVACYQAKLFDKADSYEYVNRQNDRSFMQDRIKAVSAIGTLAKILKRHTVSGRLPAQDTLIETLQTLKSRLSDDTRWPLLYRQKHGCFIYPKPVYEASLPTAPRMLAAFLVVFFRLISSGQLALAIQGGWEMPSTRTGRPKHGLVDDLIQMTFNKGINSQEVETSFRNSSPGLKIVSWNLGQPTNAPQK